MNPVDGISSSNLSGLGGVGGREPRLFGRVVMSNRAELGLRGAKFRLLPEVGTLLLSKEILLLPGILTKVRELGGLLGGVSKSKVLRALVVVGASSTSLFLEEGVPGGVVAMVSGVPGVGSSSLSSSIGNVEDNSRCE
jgi:hypothetical protein